MFGQSGPSLADIAAVIKGNNGNGNGGFMGNDGIWAIILFAMIFGWGRNGFGNNGNGGNCGNSCCCPQPQSPVVVVSDGAHGHGHGYGFEDAAIQRGFNNQAVISKLDGLTQGLCDNGYTNLSQFNNILQALASLGFNTERSINQQTIAQMQQANATQAQISSCCCDLKTLIAQLGYELATQSCDTRRTVQDAARDIMTNDNNNYQRLHDEFTNYRIEQLQQTINDKDSLIASLSGNINNSAQTQTIVNAIQGMIAAAQENARNCPYPSYNVANPNCCQPQLSMQNLIDLLQGQLGGNCGCGNRQYN